MILLVVAIKNILLGYGIQGFYIYRLNLKQLFLFRWTCFLYFYINSVFTLLVLILKKSEVLMENSQRWIQDLNKHLRWGILHQLQSSLVFDFVGLCYTSDSALTQLGNYLLKVNNRNTRTRCEVCSHFVMGVHM